ncbi:hypothetical protein EYV94_03580 [Puteibacter caeruleilacunae]|nr:hypothetical protein EYV94_03580 [Puteibacter caeruleilacunae]
MVSIGQLSAKTNNSPISEKAVEHAISTLKSTYPSADAELIKRGVNHAASLWRSEDGSIEEFKTFCKENFLSSATDKKATFDKLSFYLESILGHYNKMSLDLQENVHLNTGPLSKVDRMFAAYSANAHWKSDFYANKIAFMIALNFPYYPTSEKIAHAQDWSRQEWAYARMGDVFSARVPSKLLQQYGQVNAASDAYIAEYNIYMGNLVNKKKKRLFPEDMVLLSHWNLRDEIKANYANKDNGIEKQDMIYQVMKRIIDQTIPEQVINSGNADWNPYANEVFENGKKVAAKDEPNTRYAQIVNAFNALKAIDAYHPVMDTYIKRKFSGEMQIPQPEVEQLFHEFLSSPQVKKVGSIIKKRLGRNLKPYDIWYDGFKARSSISEDKLNQITQKKYPDAKAMEADLANMLLTLGFTKEKADFLQSKISVDAARGSGHAWGAGMKSENAHLRTRVPESGMNYKGYNIAVHEFGHNVEQTISLHDVDYYLMNGVPNTAHTEALAFVFQERDLFLLHMKDDNPDKEYLKTLDIFWSLYEIMGVSMVDMKMWKWMYANPDCTPAELKVAVMDIAKDVWNTYYAPVFGSKDEPILAIYSHMVSYPLYLSAYSFGHLIHFQLEEHFKNHHFATEVERIFALGQLTPNKWMVEAVGTPISNDPILKAADIAIEKMK